MYNRWMYVKTHYPHPLFVQSEFIAPGFKFANLFFCPPPNIFHIAICNNKVISSNTKLQMLYFIYILSFKRILDVNQFSNNYNCMKIKWPKGMLRLYGLVRMNVIERLKKLSITVIQGIAKNCAFITIRFAQKLLKKAFAQTNFAGKFFLIVHLYCVDGSMYLTLLQRRVKCIFARFFILETVYVVVT